MILDFLWRKEKKRLAYWRVSKGKLSTVIEARGLGEAQKKGLEQFNRINKAWNIQDDSIMEIVWLARIDEK